MRDPDPQLRADADEDGTPPDFDALTPAEDLVRGERTRDDFFDAVLTLDSPATVTEVAQRAGHGEDAAREYLEWFERMGIVTRVSESPATYERNREYLTWRRVQRVREEYTTEEILDALAMATDRAETYAETFGVDSPSAIPIADRATETDRSVEEVWEDVTDWQTARRRIALLERALRSESTDPVDSRTPV